ncbi:MAG: AbrB/MazE/SpoVT family DNA-binding domain-containing protein [Acidobacteria bacterium]|nr:AbrB/MazE/SpoVT family DNA-binding domain-containing protein [Acidobacteriota bacterium]
MTEIRAQIGAGGRVVIPAVFRRALGLEVGDEVMLVLDGEEVRLLTARRAVARVQEAVARYVTSPSLAKELLADRRVEVERG